MRGAQESPNYQGTSLFPEMSNVGMVAGLVLLLVQFLVPAILQAQEVHFIDLRGVQQRTGLRSLPASFPECRAGTVCGGASGVGTVIMDGAPDPPDPGAITIQILSALPDRIDTVQPIELEFRVFNSGSVSLEIPISPHLSDLQPADESQSFSYSSLNLGVNIIVGRPQTPPIVNAAAVELYGSKKDPTTTLVLKPAEWMRIRAGVQFSSLPAETLQAGLKGTFTLRTNTFYPRAGGAFTEIRNLYPNAGDAPELRVQIIPVK